MEVLWKWLIPIIPLIGAFLIWFYKFRERRANALKAETELKELKDKGRIDNEVERIYPQVNNWIKEQRRGLITMRSISLEELKRNFSADGKTLEQIWKLLIDQKEVVYKTSGIEGYFILPRPELKTRAF